MAKEARAKSPCITPGCSTGSRVRGICGACYASISRTIRNAAKNMYIKNPQTSVEDYKQMLWIQLEESGKVLPRSSPGRKRSTLATEWIGDVLDTLIDDMQ